MLPGVDDLARAGLVPGGSRRNRAAADAYTDVAPGVDPVLAALAADAQTSGGLLLAVPPENEAALLEALRREATPAAAVIGRITSGPPGRIRVTRRL